MHYTVLDLEWNGAYSEKTADFLNEIIQFGAVRLDENLNEIGQFSTFVRPAVSKKLTGLVKRLTNITNEDIAGGIPFLAALEKFRRFSENSILMTWGTCDIRELITNYRYHMGMTELPLKNDWVDLQAYCQLALREPSGQQMGLSGAAEKLGISCEEMSLHRAIDDSILSAACFAKLFDAERLEKMRVNLDARLCEKMVFRAQMITDFNDSRVDKSKFRFKCPACNQKLRLDSEWKVANKQFVADLHCPGCEKKYRGHVQFKQRFEDIQIRRRLTESVPQEDETPETEAPHAD